MSFAVVDSAGNLMELAGMDDARWLATGVVQGQAFKAATSRKVAEIAEATSVIRRRGGCDRAAFAIGWWWVPRCLLTENLRAQLVQAGAPRTKILSVVRPGLKL